VQLVVNIVLLTAIYALIACGYVLIYRTSRVLSLAHGELMMLGAYLLVTTASFAAADPVAGIAVAVAMSAVVGLLVYAVLMRHMTGESVLAAVLVTIALGILLRGGIVLVWSAQQQRPLEALGLSNPAVPLFGGAVISAAGLATVVLAVTTYLALYAFFRFSRWGVRMRAAGENPLLAAQRGVQLHGVYAGAWALATLTGGLAGILLSLDSGLDQTMVTIGLKAFPAALVGGLDSLAGAVLGAMIVAVAEVLAIHYVSPLLSEVAPFIVLTVMLIVRPWGLFGTREQFDRV
jgi:branched-chain amino acid transport system permease protein